MYITLHGQNKYHKKIINKECNKHKHNKLKNKNRNHPN